MKLFDANTTILSLESSFKRHKKLYEDISILDPKNFSNPLAPNCFDNLAKLPAHYAQINIHEFCDEFQDLVSKWKTLKNSVDRSNLDSDSEGETQVEKNESISKSKFDSCKNYVVTHTTLYLCYVNLYPS